jgi:hypothetical protein
MTKRPRDAAGLARVVVDMATGEVPNDKDEVLAAMNGQDEPTGRAKGAKARAASQTPERRTEIARKAAAARWEGSQESSTD